MTPKDLLASHRYPISRKLNSTEGPFKLTAEYVRAMI